MSKIKKLWKSTWFVTMTSSIIGIVFGIYLTSYLQNRSLVREQKHAMSRVFQELKQNKENLQECYDTLTLKHNGFKYFAPYLIDIITDEKEDFVIHKDSLDLFKQQTRSIVLVESIESIADSIKIDGEFNLQINVGSPILLTGLSHIIWDVYRNTDFLSITDFDCLSELETIYALKERLRAENKLFVDNLLSINNTAFQTDEKVEELMSQWENLLREQEMLLNGLQRILDGQSDFTCHQYIDSLAS